MRGPEQLPHRPPIAIDNPEGPGLDEYVAQCRGLDRPGLDGHAARVGGELTEQRVPGSASDDVYDVDLATGEALGVAHR